MQGFEFRARYNAANKENGKTTITVKNLAVITGSGVLPIEPKLEKEQLYTFHAGDLICNPVFNL